MISLGQIRSSEICIIPPPKLIKYICNIRVLENAPIGIKNLIFKSQKKERLSSGSWKPKYLLSDIDKNYLDSLNLSYSNKHLQTNEIIDVPFDSKYSLNLQDLHWIYHYIRVQNKKTQKKIYLHELMDGFKILLPKNEKIPLNEELVERCKKLKDAQQNLEYKNMIRNIESDRTLPEDTISYQLKVMNQHLIAILQFIISVAAGFAFGFIGIELLVGRLDFGFRLLLGIIGGLIIALAELYFLAKKLNEC